MFSRSGSLGSGLEISSQSVDSGTQVSRLRYGPVIHVWLRQVPAKENWDRN